jgi:O-antigen ligase
VQVTGVPSGALGHEPVGQSGRGYGFNIVSVGLGPPATDGPDLASRRKGLTATTVVAILTVQVSGLGLQMGSISLRPEHLLPFLLVSILAQRGRLGKNLPLVVILYTPFLWYLTVSLLGAPDAADSLQNAMALVTATAALPCFVVLGEELGGVRLLNLWLAVGTAVNGFGLALYATGLGGIQFDVATGHVVAEGLAYEANIYGSQAGALLVAALAFPSLAGRRLGIQMAVVNACALVLSQARGAWLACAVVLVLTTMTRHIAVRRLLVLLALVGSTGLFVFGISQLSLRTADAQTAVLRDLGTRAQSLTDTSSGTGAFRLRTWQLALQDIYIYPFTGSGIGSYAWLHGDFTRPGQRGHLSNIYLGWLHSGGIIGTLLICMSVVLYVRILGGVRTAMANPALHAVLVLAIAYVATDGSWLAWPWALAGVAIAYGRCW